MFTLPTTSTGQIFDINWLKSVWGEQEGIINLGIANQDFEPTVRVNYFNLLLSPFTREIDRYLSQFIVINNKNDEDDIKKLLASPKYKALAIILNKWRYIPKPNKEGALESVNIRNFKYHINVESSKWDFGFITWCDNVLTSKEEKYNFGFVFYKDVIDSLITIYDDLEIMTEMVGFKFSSIREIKQFRGFKIVDKYNKDTYKDIDSLKILKDVSHQIERKGFGFLLYGLVEFVEGDVFTDMITDYSITYAFYRPSEDIIKLNAASYANDARKIYSLLHELGHRLWFLFLTDKERKIFKADFQKNSGGESNYAFDNEIENFAESFACFCINTDHDPDAVKRFRATVNKFIGDDGNNLIIEPKNLNMINTLMTPKQKYLSYYNNLGISLDGGPLKSGKFDLEYPNKLFVSLINKLGLNPINESKHDIFLDRRVQDFLVIPKDERTDEDIEYILQIRNAFNECLHVLNELKNSFPWDDFGKNLKGVSEDIDLRITTLYRETQVSPKTKTAGLEDFKPINNDNSYKKASGNDLEDYQGDKYDIVTIGDVITHLLEFAASLSASMRNSVEMNEILKGNIKFDVMEVIQQAQDTFYTLIPKKDITGVIQQINPLIDKIETKENNYESSYKIITSNESKLFLWLLDRKNKIDKICKSLSSVEIDFNENDLPDQEQIDFILTKIDQYIPL